MQDFPESHLGENAIALVSIAGFCQHKRNWIDFLSIDSMSLVQGDFPYAMLYSIAREHMDFGEVFEARVATLAAIFIEQCQVHDSQNAITAQCPLL